MSYAFSNRKRIRGWKQLVRKLERLEARHAELNPRELAESGWSSYELWLSPFSDLIPRNPPGWYFRLYVASMLRVMDRWENTLREREDDYYLALWLFEPRQCKSQVVAAVDHRIDFYRRRFRDNPTATRFPQSVAPLQSQLDWAAKWHHYEYWIDNDDSPAHVEKLRQIAIDEASFGEDTVLYLSEGTLWIHDRSSLKTDSSVAP